MQVILFAGFVLCIVLVGLLFVVPLVWRATVTAGDCIWFAISVMYERVVLVPMAMAGFNAEKRHFRSATTLTEGRASLMLRRSRKLMFGKHTNNEGKELQNRIIQLNRRVASCCGLIRLLAEMLNVRHTSELAEFEDVSQARMAVIAAEDVVLDDLEAMHNKIYSVPQFVRMKVTLQVLQSTCMNCPYLNKPFAALGPVCPVGKSLGVKPDEANSFGSVSGSLSE